MLQLLPTNGLPQQVESSQAARGTAEALPDQAGGQRLRLTFEAFRAAAGLRVTLDGRLDADAPYVRWSMTVENPARLALQAVRFPYVKAASALGLRTTTSSSGRPCRA